MLTSPVLPQRSRPPCKRLDWVRQIIHYLANIREQCLILIIGAAQAGEQISSDGYFIRTKADGTTEKISRVSHVGKEYNEWDNGGGSCEFKSLRCFP